MRGSNERIWKDSSSKRRLNRTSNTRDQNVLLVNRSRTSKVFQSLKIQTWKMLTPPPFGSRWSQRQRYLPSDRPSCCAFHRILQASERQTKGTWRQVNGRNQAISQRLSFEANCKNEERRSVIINLQMETIDIFYSSNFNEIGSMSSSDSIRVDDQFDDKRRDNLQFISSLWMRNVYQNVAIPRKFRVESLYNIIQCGESSLEH